MSVLEMEKILSEKCPQASFQSDETGKTGARLSVSIPISGIRDAAGAFNDAGFFLEDIVCIDFEDTLELVYRFNRYDAGSRVVVRLLCGRDQAPATISDIFRGAAWLEREVHDFFGIKFSGNSDLRPLLLPEDADYHPLLKDFGKVGAYLKREKIYG